MALYKLEEFYPNYQKELFDGDDIKGIDIYAKKTREKIGTLDTALVDETGQFCYLVADIGFWIFGRKVLLPVTYCQIDEQRQCIYAAGILNKKQLEKLPEYNYTTKVDSQYEERVKRVYRLLAKQTLVTPLETSVPLEASASLEASYRHSNSERDRYKNQQILADGNNRSDRRTLRLYGERLVANKKRRQTGEVIVGKHIETKKERVFLPLEKERVIIERTTPEHSEVVAFSDDIDFRAGELTRLKVYEETADIHKEAFVREEVRITKEIKRDTVEAEETLRLETLDIDAKGSKIVDESFAQQSKDCA